ncbi:Hpt domain-containing protein [Ruminococcaceae bacterium OttesenSCG-928-D13]|nr:Hpt domain-containing protein [Ruminococcaceae bacterium OttesenSCG-928-D13]
MDTPQDLKAYIDLDAGLGRVRGNKMIYGKMLGLFTGSTEFDAMETALAAEDWPKVAEVAHGIKGMTGNLGFTKLFDTSTELMVKAREGKPEDALVADYRDALDKTREYVKVVEAQLQG